MFARYPTEALSLQHRLEPGNFAGDLAAITAHPLFSFAKHRLRLDLCEFVLRTVAEGGSIPLADIAKGLGDADRAVLPRTAAFLAKLGMIRIAGAG